ncbi:Flp pilus assembly protein CpaB [Anaerobacillus sp. MEB173]|uniref:Flp pilus assembly protein CpaB n=1 Tax=Anaerobacillus sp. MEB173 TaxID=3383345 RepID=UPI003F934832
MKKLWMLAITFGMVMSILIYLVASQDETNEQSVMAAQEVVEETSPEEDPVDAFEIEAGKRAMSIAVNSIQSVSGFVRPGSYVDIVAVLPLPTDEHTSSQVILSNVKIIAVGKTVTNEPDANQEPYEMVTLEVSPSEGATLAYVQEIGVMTLMLRGGEDEAPSPQVKISLEQLMK